VENHARTHDAQGAPLHGPLKPPLNALRVPLRRYPCDPATAGVAGATSVTTESSAAERFSSTYMELISHVG
jgi:hypothetical protein